METESDPLAITPDDNRALFGDFTDNIEFVVLSDDEDSDFEMEDDNVAIKIDHLDEQEIEEFMNRSQDSNSPCITPEENQMIDTDTVEIKEEIDEIDIEAMDIKPIHEKQYTPIIYERLENANQGGTQLCCYVPDCASEFSSLSSQNNDRIYWFNVPKDENLRKIWNICIGHAGRALTREDLVCHKHFPDADIIHEFAFSNNNREIMVPYNNPRLRQGAVPCIQFHEECCVPTCRRTTGKMYCFPVLRTSDFHLWMYMIKNPDLKNLKMKEVLRHRVCDIHFESDCFDADFLLKRTAAPTLHVPENYIVGLGNIKPVSSGKAVTSAETDIIILICAHGECPNRSNCGKRLFRFPMVADRCIAWLKACGRTNLISSPVATLRKMNHLRLGVCEDHFDFQDFEEENMDLLKPTATPKYVMDFRKSKAFSTGTGNYVTPGVSNCLKSFVGICAYRGCQSKQSTNNPFFSFPCDTERSEKWLRACGLLKRKQNLSNMKICSKHFDKDMFDPLNRLKNYAIPVSYNLYKRMEDEKNQAAVNSATSAITKEQQKNEHSPMTLKGNTLNVKQEQSIELLSTKKVWCAVQNCQQFFNSRQVSVSNYKFPNPVKDRQRFNIWLRLIANPELTNLSSEEIYNKYLVCGRHFEMSFYRKDGKATYLSQEAVPTKNLPEDNQWFFTSEYYNTRLQNYFDNVAVKDFPDDTVEWKEDDNQNEEIVDKTKCVLEADRIRFPGMGHYLYMGQRVDKGRAPYNVYNYFNIGYGLNRNVEIGESIKIHTAIIIDDDDDCERRVLQELLDKRKKKP